MKRSFFVVPVLAMTVLSFNVVRADESSKDAAQAQVESKTSHNPITSTTTTTVKKSLKHKIHTDQGTATEEDNSKVEHSVKDDGSKSSTKREATQTIEQKQ